VSLVISSRVYPAASFAAIFAMGNPVALEASAEDRLTRGFISIPTMRPVFGWTPNWMFDPPVSTPMARITWRAMSRMVWYSTSESVCAGATVIESPVCTPIGSTFSMLQMITTLSALSRITSSSNSFQPSTDSSISTSWVGLQRVWPLGSEDPLGRLHRDRLDVGAIRPLGVGHDGGRVGVEQDGAVPLLPEGLERLHAGVVELAGLPDDDGPRAEQEDGLE